MSDTGRKYKILPGVPTTDYDAIIKASSDYTEPGELDFVMRKYTLDSEKKRKVTSANSAQDVDELKKLGVEVSEQEERSKEESQARMEAIKARNVMAPASIEALREVASKKHRSEEKQEEIDAELRVRDEEAAQQDALEKARAERREQQKKAVEELKARAAKLEADAAAKAAEAAKVAEAARAKEEEEASNNNLILSDEETADSFSEFL